MKERVEAASRSGAVLIVAVAPGAARAFGGWLAPLLADATLLLLNPGRTEGEAFRIAVPDLSHRGPGRGVLVDRGRTRIVQVAAQVAPHVDVPPKS
jgi:hypothetical protein